MAENYPYFLVKCIGGFGEDFNAFRDKELKEDYDAYKSALCMHKGEIEKFLGHMKKFFSSECDRPMSLEIYNPMQSLSCSCVPVSTLQDVFSALWKLSAEMGPEGFYFKILFRIDGEPPYEMKELSDDNAESFVRSSPNCTATCSLGYHLDTGPFPGIDISPEGLAYTVWYPEGVYSSPTGGKKVVMRPSWHGGRNLALTFSPEDLSKCFVLGASPGTPLQVKIPYRKLFFVWDFGDPFMGWRVLEEYGKE
jgi:hypothetical protein